MTIDACNNIDKLLELFMYFKFCIKEIEEDMKILKKLLSEHQCHGNSNKYD